MAFPQTTEPAICAMIARNVCDLTDERRRREAERRREDGRKRSAEAVLEETQKRLREIRPLSFLPDLEATIQAASRSRLRRLLGLTADIGTRAVRQTAQDKAAELERDERFHKSRRDQAERELQRISTRLDQTNRLIEQSFAEARRNGCDMSRIRSCGF